MTVKLIISQSMLGRDQILLPKPQFPSQSLPRAKIRVAEQNLPIYSKEGISEQVDHQVQQSIVMEAQYAQGCPQSFRRNQYLRE